MPSKEEMLPKTEDLRECLRSSFLLHKGSCMSSFTALLITCARLYPEDTLRVLLDSTTAAEGSLMETRARKFYESIGWLREEVRAANKKKKK